MIWRLAIWGEGSTDRRVLLPILGRTVRELSGLADADFDTLISQEEPTFRKLSEVLRADAVLPRRLHGRVRGVLPFSRKLLVALDNARIRHPSTLFIAIWDHDADPGR